MFKCSVMLQWYKVERVQYEFWNDSGEAGGGETPGEPWVAPVAHGSPIVIVSLVP